MLTPFKTDELNNETLILYSYFCDHSYRSLLRVPITWEEASHPISLSPRHAARRKQGGTGWEEASHPISLSPGCMQLSHQLSGLGVPPVAPLNQATRQSQRQLSKHREPSLRQLSCLGLTCAAHLKLLHQIRYIKAYLKQTHMLENTPLLWIAGRNRPF